MTQVKVVITSSRVTRIVRKWGDPVLVDRLGATTANLTPPSNFQAVKLASFWDNGTPDFNDVSKYQSVDKTYLPSLQVADECTVEQKMNWLIGEMVDGKPSRPYWTKGTDVLYFGTIVFGGQLVEIDTTPVYKWGKFPARNYKEWIKFYHLVGQPVQFATGAGVNNYYDLYPRGLISHPIWNDAVYKSNIGDGKLYIAADFLE